MWRKLTLGQRIALGAATLVFFVVVASALGFWYARTAAGTLDATQDSVQQISHLARLESSWSRVSATIDRMLLTRQATMIDDDLATELATFNGELAALSDQSFGNQPRVMERNAEIVANLQSFGEELNGVVDQIQDAAVQRRWAEAQVLRHTELATLQPRFDESLDELRANTRQQIDLLVAQSVRRQRATGVYLTIGLIVALVLGAALTILGVRAIIDPINQLIERTRRVTEGDFSYVMPLERNDEIGALSASFSVMTEWLADSYQVLEERVEERTQDLALAAEIGRRLGRVRDLDALLQDAVDLIQSHFELYYTQVYLTSDEGRSLILRAGTGDVGRELRQRGFKLPVDRGSINGSAVVDRRAVVIADTDNSGLFRPNSLLPDTRAEIAIPLRAGERVVGVLDLQSDRRYGLSEDNLAAFDVLAGQLAIAIENALLFDESRAVRAELESQAQGRIRESWQTFLNAVDRPERLIYAYRNGVVGQASRAEALSAVGDNSLKATIALNEVPIGRIRLKAQPQQRWSDQDLEVVEEVGRLVAQRVDNLRLLAEAEHYRDEAEEALRRLTREGWQDLGTDTSAYHYDGRQVVSFEGDLSGEGLSRKLVVRGQAVGEIQVSAGDEEGEMETDQLLSAVAARLSAHLEQLRLSQQTENALAAVQRRSEELGHLNRVVTRIAGTLDLRNSLQIVVDELVALTTADQARIGLLNEERTALTIVSEEFDERLSPSALGMSIPVEGNDLTQEVLTAASPVVIADAQRDPLTAPIRDMLREQGIQTMVVLPILAGNEVIGTVGADILREGVAFSEDDLRLAETIVFQAATAIQNARLFDQIQSTLAETRALYRASAELNRARTYDDLLDVLRQHTVAGDGSTTISLALFDTPWANASRPRWIDILAYWTPEPVNDPTLRFQLEEYPALAMMERDQLTQIEDVQHDARLDPRSRRILRRAFKAGALLSVPLVAGGQWIGHVNAVYPEPRSFSTDELQQFQNLAGQAAVAVQSINLLEETSRLLESEQRQRRISDTLVRATSRMLGVMDEQEIRQVVLEEIENLLGPDQITLYTWEQEPEGLSVESRKVLRGAGQDAYGEGEMIDVDDRRDLWRVLRIGRPRLSQTYEGDDFAREHFMLPWLVGNDIAGVIEVYHTARGTSIREEDQASVEGIVQQAAIRLQNARLFDEAEMRTAETEALYRASRQINVAASYGEIMDALRQTTILGHRTGSVSLHYFDRPWDEEAIPEQVEVLARWSETPVEHQDRGYLLAEFGAAGKILNADSVSAIDDVRSDERLDDGSRSCLLAQFGSANLLFVPLRAGGQWLGFIAAAYTGQPAIAEADVRRLMALASQAAAAIQSLYLLRGAQARAQRERVLREITGRVRSATDVDVIMKTAVREVSRALGRDAYVTLGDRGENGGNGAARVEQERGEAD